MRCGVAEGRRIGYIERLQPEPQLRRSVASGKFLNRLKSTSVRPGRPPRFRPTRSETWYQGPPYEDCATLSSETASAYAARRPGRLDLNGRAGEDWEKFYSGPERSSREHPGPSLQRNNATDAGLSDRDHLDLLELLLVHLD